MNSNNYCFVGSACYILYFPSCMFKFIVCNVVVGGVSFPHGQKLTTLPWDQYFILGRSDIFKLI